MPLHLFLSSQDQMFRVLPQLWNRYILFCSNVGKNWHETRSCAHTHTVWKNWKHLISECVLRYIKLSASSSCSNWTFYSSIILVHGHQIQWEPVAVILELLEFYRKLKLALVERHQGQTLNESSSTKKDVILTRCIQLNKNTLILMRQCAGYMFMWYVPILYFIIKTEWNNHHAASLSSVSVCEIWYIRDNNTTRIEMGFCKVLEFVFPEMKVV